MTLDELTKALERCPATVPVKYDFGSEVGHLASWRGVYAELTLTHGDKPQTVADLLEDCRKADGGEFTGYKGGEFTMSGWTPVWADDYGDCYHRIIVGVDGTSEPDRVIIRTTVIPDEYR